MIADKWFSCGNCRAEFDKKLGKAQLVSAEVDPYGVFKKFSNQTLTMDEWKKVISGRINAENYDHEEEISRLKTTISDYLQQQIVANKFQVLI